MQRARKRAPQGGLRNDPREKGSLKAIAQMIGRSRAFQGDGTITLPIVAKGTEAARFAALQRIWLEYKEKARDIHCPAPFIPSKR